MDSVVRRKKRDEGTFTTITEDDDDSKENTVNRDDMMEPFDDSENYEPGTSTTMNPALKKFSL